MSNNEALSERSSMQTTLDQLVTEQIRTLEHKPSDETPLDHPAQAEGLLESKIEGTSLDKTRSEVEAKDAVEHENAAEEAEAAHLGRNGDSDERRSSRSYPLAATDQEDNRGSQEWREGSKIRLNDYERTMLSEELRPYSFILREAEAKVFKGKLSSFTENVHDLIEKLTNVSNAILRLFPYSHIPNSTHGVRLHFLALLFKLHESASYQFPGIKEPDPHSFFDDILKEMKSSGKTVKLKDNKGMIKKSAASSLNPPPDTLRAPIMKLLEFLLRNITAFSKDLKTFSDHMNVTATDEMDEVYETVTFLSDFIERWTESGLGKSGSMMEVYEHDLMFNMNDHIKSFCRTLHILLSKGLPEIEEEFKEQEKRTSIENLTLLAGSTLFSSITASTLSLSLGQKSTLYDAVNFFWFTSLVFSIGSVMNSLVAFTWKHSIFRKRAKDEQLPMLIAFWSRESPLYFLVISALTFVVGLCLLAYASGQASVTSAITTIWTSLSIFGIVGTTAWFIAEYYKYRKSPLDSASKLDSHIHNRLFRYVRDHFPLIAKHFEKLRSSFMKLGGHFRNSKNYLRDLLSPCFPSRGIQQDSNVLGNLEEGSDADSLSEDNLFGIGPLSRAMEGDPDVTRGEERALIVMPKLIGVLETVKAKGLKLEGDLDLRSGEISFSTDGKMLGITGGTSSVLYQITDRTFSHIVDKRAEGEDIQGKIIWSPQSDAFLLRSTKGIQIWQDEATNKDKHRKFALARIIPLLYNKEDTEFFSWYPDGSSFCRVNESSIRKYSIGDTGKPALDISLFDEETEVEIEDRTIRNATIIAAKEFESPRLLISTSANVTRKGTSLTRASKLKQHELIVYDIEKRKVDRRIPLFGETNSLCVSKNEKELLIGYAEMQPQLWSILSRKALEFKLQQSYPYTTWTKPPDKTIQWMGQNSQGRTFFLGPADDFIVSWSYYRDNFQVWDKATSVPLYLIERSYAAGAIRSIALNESSDALTFASLSFDGAVALWNASSTENEE